MSNGICTVNDCDREAFRRGWCHSHYQRWRRGRPLDAPLRSRGKNAGLQCEIDGCNQPARTRKLCEAHYGRWRIHGDPTHGGAVAHAGRSATERFWSKVAKTDNCWNWTAATNQYGYPVFRGDEGKNYLAHRYSYRLVHGDIPNGGQIDHRCHNSRCVNPNHLRLVTNKQNQENLSGPRSAASGVRGVYKSRTGKWYGQVGHNGATYCVGTFSSLEEAESAVIAKRNELFTHNDIDRLGA